MLHPEECQIFRRECGILSLFSLEGITTEKLKVIQEWPTKKNKYEIRSCLDRACITDCRDRELKQQRSFSRMFRKTIGLEIMKRTVRYSIRIQKTNVKTLHSS
jgi:hypothetical protein